MSPTLLPTLPTLPSLPPPAHPVASTLPPLTHTPTLWRQISGFSVGEIRVVASMHERKALMFEAADAFITIPGGGCWLAVCVSRLDSGADHCLRQQAL